MSGNTVNLKIGQQKFQAEHKVTKKWEKKHNSRNRGTLSKGVTYNFSIRRGRKREGVGVSI